MTSSRHTRRQPGHRREKNTHQYPACEKQEAANSQDRAEYVRAHVEALVGEVLAQPQDQVDDLGGGRER